VHPVLVTPTRTKPSPYTTAPPLRTSLPATKISTQSVLLKRRATSQFTKALSLLITNHESLLVPQRHDRIGTNRPTGRQVARHERNNSKKRSDPGDRRRIVGANVVEHVRHEPRQT
jgi:hypothetical protein